MRILIVSDAWLPQVNGVVRTIESTRDELRRRGHTVEVVGPDRFASIPCPTYPEIRLAIGQSRRMARLVDEFDPDAIHISTEGPLGWAARRYCIRRRLSFTTSFHTQFPEYVQLRTGMHARPCRRRRRRRSASAPPGGPPRPARTGCPARRRRD